MKEKQLNKVEQIKVFDSIKSDYENLLKSYEIAKTNDPTGLLPNELDMDIDLNKELGKMKDLLTDIVDKMNNNLVEDSPCTGSILSHEQIETNSSAKSVSSYGNGNHDELMDQYNRLLDVFNNDSAVEPRDKSIMDFISSQNQPVNDTTAMQSNEESVDENNARYNQYDSDHSIEQNAY